MSNQEIVRLLRNMAAALLIKGENRFRVIAYEKAADSIEHLTSEVKDIWDEGKLDEIPGIGAALTQHLNELFRTGKVRHFESTFKDISPALFKFLLIPGMGPKRAHQLTSELKIVKPQHAIDVLANAAKSGKIAKLPGWGEDSQAKLLSAFETYRKGQIKDNRMVFPFADTLAQDLIEYIKKVPGVSHVEALGSLRRKVATIGDIDLAAATIEPEKVIESFVRYSKVRKIIDRGPKGATVLLSIGRQADLRVQDPKAYGAMLQYFTGSKNHNIKLREMALKKGYSLNEYGIKNLKSNKLKEFATEEEFYNALELPWIPPELREDTGEIEAALRQAHGKQPGLPGLVSLKDIKGDLHIHSNYDLKPSHDLGSSSLENLLEKAGELGYEYIGISDHNPKAVTLSEKQIIDIMKRRKEKFEQIFNSLFSRVKKRVQLFIMLEVDIDPKGKLALPEGAFEFVDAVVVSVHSSFELNKKIMTDRVLAGLSHPKAKILSHPTARLIGKREGINLDWDNIFGFCKENHKALEINSWPERLDLPDMLVHEAVKRGVKMIINTDSHAVDQMRGMKYGVDVARRGWAEKKDILNTMGYNEFARWLKST